MKWEGVKARKSEIEDCGIESNKMEESRDRKKTRRKKVIILKNCK